VEPQVAEAKCVASSTQNASQATRDGVWTLSTALGDLEDLARRQSKKRLTALCHYRVVQIRRGGSKRLFTFQGTLATVTGYDQLQLLSPGPTN